MLPVIGFIVFWVVLAFALFFVAIRGGLGGAREALHSQTRGGRKATSWVLAIVYVAFGVAIPILILSGNHAKANNQIGGIKLNASEKRGRVLFGQNCGVCHTLAGANAAGKVGPNLDSLKPPKSLVLTTVNNGCLQSAAGGSPQACLGIGNMPSAIVQGKDATDVAAFVAKVAGNE